MSCVEYECAALLLSCEDGDLEAVQSLLADGISPSVTENWGVAPLHVAAANGHVEITKLLLSYGADLDQSDGFGWTALMQATRHGHNHLVKLLLESGADRNKRNRLGCDAAMTAAAGGHSSALQLLFNDADDDELDAMLHPSTPQDVQMTPLLVACLQGHEKVVGGLLQSGANPNERLECSGVTALMLAASAGHKNVIDTLLANGADVAAVNAFGMTALDVACSRGCGEAETVLERFHKLSDTGCPAVSTCSTVVEQQGTENATFATAAFTGDLDACKRLLQQGSDINERELGTGLTPLMHATLHNRTPVAKYLLESGADVNLVDDNGYTALDLAAVSSESNADLIKILAERGAQVPFVLPEKAQEEHSEDSAFASNTVAPVVSSEGAQEKSSSNGTVVSVEPVSTPTPPYSSLVVVHHDCLQDTGLPWIARKFTSDELKPVLPPPLPQDEDLVADFADLLEEKRSVLRMAFESRASPESQVSRSRLSRMKRFREEDEEESHSGHPPKTRVEESDIVFRAPSVQQNRVEVSNEPTGDPKVEELLRQLSLEKYCPLFDEHEIDMESIFALTELDMKEIGMQTLDRKALMKVIYSE